MEASKDSVEDIDLYQDVVCDLLFFFEGLLGKGGQVAAQEKSIWGLKM